MLANQIYHITLILFGIFASVQGMSQCVSVQSGDWATPSTWSCGDPPTAQVPSCTDIPITIAFGDTVEITSQQDYSACGEFIVIYVEGVLNFAGNGPKLRLPIGSYIGGNGSIIATAQGSGNANFIEIGPDIVWRKADGDVPGPFQFPANHPLPIELVSFEGTAGIDAVYFSWEVASELNNDYYTIERSPDMETWSVVHLEPGNGTSSENITYRGKDASPKSRLMYYRLSQTDFNGAREIFDPIAVNFSTQGSKNNQTTLYPNPLTLSGKKALHIQNWNEDIEHIVITDLNGHAVQEIDQSEISNSSRKIEINHRTFHPGIYFVKIKGPFEVKSMKLYVR